MLSRSTSCIVTVGLALVWAPLPAASDEPSQDESAVRKAARDYAAALASGDRDAVAEFWTEDGQYFDQSGQPHPASELIAEAVSPRQAAAAADTPRSSSTIRFLTPEVALEDGVSEVSLPAATGHSPIRGQYHATWVKRDGRWRLASLCEAPIIPDVASTLEELGWMVGEWTADDAGVNLHVSVRWNATGTFLLRDLKATNNDNVVFRSTQRIGRDPATDKLTSWSFDSDGGRGEATWTRQENSWIAQGSGVLPNGQPTSGTVVVDYESNDAFIYKTLAAMVDGTPVADHTVRFSRKSDTRQ